MPWWAWTLIGIGVYLLAFAFAVAFVMGASIASNNREEDWYG